MLFFISDLAVSAAFKIGGWVLTKTCNGVSYVVNAAVAAYGRNRANEEETETETLIGVA
jgi:hypothetical protein